MTDAKNEGASGATASNAGLGCERLCVDFCNKYEVSLAEIRRLRERVERLRGALKTASGWCFDMTSDDSIEYEWIKRADLLLECAGDMEPNVKLRGATDDD